MRTFQTHLWCENARCEVAALFRRHFGATVSPLLPLGGTISVPIPWVVQQIAASTLIEAQLVVWVLHLVAIGPPLPVGRLILGSRVVMSGETVTLSIGVDSLPKGSNTVNPIRKGRTRCARPFRGSTATQLLQKEIIANSAGMCSSTRGLHRCTRAWVSSERRGRRAPPKWMSS